MSRGAAAHADPRKPRFHQDEATRRQREHDEAKRLLQDQWSLVGTGAAGEIALPAELAAHYRELLRIYVIMGSGNLSTELRCLAEIVATAGLSAPANVATASAAWLRS